MMGLAMVLYVGSALVRHVSWQISYISAVMMIIGLAHAISSMLLRWKVQGVVALIWWAGGVAVFFAPRAAAVLIFALEMFLGMVVFGLYAMWLEGRSVGGCGNAG
jgi:hypothetical protein